MALPVPKPAALLADKGYDGDRFRENLLLNNILPVIPPRSNRKAPEHPDYRRYRDRNRVERIRTCLGFIRGMAVTSASAADGRLLRQVVSTDNTSSEVWADSAYRSRRNEKWLSDQMLTSRIHRRKPMGKPMSRATARANAAKSSIRAHVEHIFAHQKNRFGLFIRTIGLARAEAKLTLCNLAYNFNRLIFHERRECRG